MPLTPFLEGAVFSPEQIAVMVGAYEAALRHGPLLAAVHLIAMTPEARAPLERAMETSTEAFADRWAAVQRVAFARWEATRGVLGVA